MRLAIMYGNVQQAFPVQEKAARHLRQKFCDLSTESALSTRHDALDAENKVLLI